MKKLIPTLCVSFFIILITTVLSYSFLKNRTQKAKYETEASLYNIDEKDYNLIQYKDFNQLKNYIFNSKEEFEILYFGFPDCPYCNGYTPIINNITKSVSKPVLYYNITEKIDAETKTNDIIFDSDGTAHNTKEYEEILNFVNLLCNDAVDKEYIKEKKVENNGKETSLMRLYVPRYFIIKDNKIIDCFMPSSVDGINLNDYEENSAERKEKEKYIADKFKEFIGRYL